MNEFDHEYDQHFDENVRRVADAHGYEGGPDAGVLASCEQMLADDAVMPTSKRSVFKHPAVLSLCGMAASIAVVVSLIVPWGSVSTVQAADVLARLNEKVACSSVIELVFDNIVRGQNVMDGHLFVSDDVVAGDLYIHAEDDEKAGAFTLDMSLAFQPDGGWALIRQLVVPDPQVAALARMFITPGSETLLLLPAPDGDAGVVVSSMDLSGHEVINAIKGFISEQAGSGAAVEQQDDGNVLVTVPITSSETLGSLTAAAGSMCGSKSSHGPSAQGDGGMSFAIGIGASGEVAELAKEIDTEADKAVVSEDPFGGDDFLVGSTLHVLYEPNAGDILAIELVDVGDAKGFMTIDFRDGDVDQKILDVEKVKKPGTRVVDLNQLSGMFKFSTKMEATQAVEEDE